MTTASERAAERAAQRSREHGARLYGPRRTQEQLVQDPITGEITDYIRERPNR